MSWKLFLTALSFVLAVITGVLVALNFAENELLAAIATIIGAVYFFMLANSS